MGISTTHIFNLGWCCWIFFLCHLESSACGSSRAVYSSYGIFLTLKNPIIFIKKKCPITSFFRGFFHFFLSLSKHESLLAFSRCDSFVTFAFLFPNTGKQFIPFLQTNIYRYFYVFLCANTLEGLFLEFRKADSEN